MKPDYKSIFNFALAISDTADRARYLDNACADDANVRVHVESLLQAHAEAHHFMQRSNDSTQTIGLKTGSIVDGYKLGEKIGEGGMGVVYVAEQTIPVRRKVALKIIKPGMDTREIIGRFQAERQALALMDHPNIAKVFDGASTENGRPYFVMELVCGVRITEYCDQFCLGIPERLRLFVTVGRAIQHAHQRGIIHRDIKPSNVLVSLHDGQAIAKVIDFGVAKAINRKLTELSVYTRFQQIIGTPLYMSPEQAELSGLEIDTRTDIYSLGVLLYELLTSVTPFDKQQFKKATYDEIRRVIREDVHPKPSMRIGSLVSAEKTRAAMQRDASPAKLAQLLNGELDWIVSKALDKDRQRRYDSAADFANDVERYLRKEPVTAAAPSHWYNLRKFIARNRVGAATSAIVLLALLLGTAGTTWQALRAMRSERSALRNLYAAEMAAASREFERLNTQGTVELIDKYNPTLTKYDFRGFEWRWLWNQCHQETIRLVGHASTLRDLRFSADGTLLASGGKDGTVRLWNVETKQEVWNYKGGSHCNHVDISPDNRLLLADFWLPSSRNPEDLPTTFLWDISDPHRPKQPRRINGGERFSPDGKTLFGIRSGKVFDVTGNLIRQISAGSQGEWLGGRHLSRDGKTLVTGSEIWDARNGKLLGKLPEHDGYIDHDWESAAVSPVDDNFIVTGCADGARIWDSAGRPIGELPDTGGTPLSGVSVSKNGDMVAVRQALGAIKVYKTSTRREIATFRTAVGNTVVFSPTENNFFLAGGEDGVIRGWRVSPDDIPDLILDHEDEVRTLDFSPDGKTLAVCTRSGSVKFWDVHRRRILLETPDDPTEVDLDLRWYGGYAFDIVSFSPDSRFAAVIGPQDVVCVWDIERQVSLQDLTFLETIRKEPEDSYWSVEFSSDGNQLYTGLHIGENGLVEIWDWTDGAGSELRRRSEHETPGTWHRSMAISPAGDLLASTSLTKTGGGGDGTQCSLWQLPDMSPLKALKSIEHEAAFLNLAFSPDGKQLAVTTLPAAVTIWDTSNWKMIASLPHSLPPEHVSWSPDCKRLVSSDATATSKLWDVETGQVVASFRGSVAELSPDGTILAIGGQGSKYIADETLVGRVTLHYAPPMEEIDRRRTVARFGTIRLDNQP